jgi:hypothetical protein
VSLKIKFKVDQRPVQRWVKVVWEALALETLVLENLAIGG